MVNELTDRGWSFTDRGRTTAEIVRALYEAIRASAGPAELIGCNTIGHLGAGLFELQRIGDDTSGNEWSRTRKMGVNTLAFRLAGAARFSPPMPTASPSPKRSPGTSRANGWT